MSCTLIRGLLPNWGPLNGVCEQTYQHKFSFFFCCKEEMRLPCATSTTGLSSLQSGGLVQSEPCLTHTGLDRRAPCHTFSTVFTCYSASHLCFVPTHHDNLLSLCGNNDNLPLRKNNFRFTQDDLQECAFLLSPPSVSLSLSPATIPSLAISAPLPLVSDGKVV